MRGNPNFRLEAGLAAGFAPEGIEFALINVETAGKTRL